jgi:nitrogen fixation/metabolism regulation signal transduction histidine kinase
LTALYLLVLHLIAGGVGAALLWQDHRPWVLLLEGGLALSAVLGVYVMRQTQMPQELVTIGKQWLKEEDFSHSFRPAGTADLQELVTLYNEMVRRLREERTRTREQDVFLTRVLAASPFGILTLDHDGRIDGVNEAAQGLLEIAENEVLGQDPASLGKESLTSLARVPQGQSVVLDRRGWSRLKVSRSRFFDRGFPRDFFVVEDLTRELWDAEKKAYDALIRTLSHEVNNTLGATGSILRSVLAYGAQLRERDRVDFDQALKVAMERTDHLGAFMRRYADVVRVPPPVRQQVDVVQLVKSIVRLLEPEARKRDIAIRVSVGEKPVTAHLDRIQMEQVLLNLLRNALEAVEARGEVKVEVGLIDGKVGLAVTDSGPGFSREARENLFTPFYSTKEGGQGIGLTLVREILRGHGFDFSVDSPPGGPTRCVLSFGSGAKGIHWTDAGGSSSREPCGDEGNRDDQD